jgi:hypothetical protein
MVQFVDKVWYSTEAQFIVRSQWDKFDYGIGCRRNGLSGYVGWRAGTTTLSHSRLYPPVIDL